MPKVENKYGVTRSAIQKAKVIDSEKLKKKPFWRNDVVNAYCLSGEVGSWEYGSAADYWLGFYDNGKIRLKVYSEDNMLTYNFDRFYAKEALKDKWLLAIQEKILERINWLIDEKIIELPKKKAS